MIFQPTLVSKLIIENVKVDLYDSVLDLGCGTGVIGINLAKRGAFVTCTDIMPEAVQETKKNIENLNLSNRMDTWESDLFEKIYDKFNIIINDVSGICDQVARLTPWYPEPIPTGGKDGSELVCKMLEKAPQYLEKGGKLYLPISSLSNTKAILETANRNFNLSLIYSRWIPFCTELEKNLNKIVNAPIRYIKKGSRHLWEFELYECS